MSTLSTLPADPEDITPEWLTDALRERFPDMRAGVCSVEVLEIRHGTNSNARLRVEYESACELPGTYFLKLLPLDPARREMTASPCCGGTATSGTCSSMTATRASSTGA